MILISFSARACRGILRDDKSPILITTEKPSITTPERVLVYEKKSDNGSGLIVGEFRLARIEEWNVDNYNSSILTSLAGISEIGLSAVFGDDATVYVWYIGNVQYYDKGKPLSAVKRNGAVVTRPPIRYMKVDSIDDKL